MSASAQRDNVILSAIVFASEMHKKQTRKGDGTPYINHPLRVADILQKIGADTETLVAAILHDVLEDTKAKHFQLRLKFGAKVANLVKEVTDDKSQSKYFRKLRQVEKVEQGILSEEAMLIKMADKIDNTRDLKKHPPPTWTDEEKVGYCAWSWKIVRGALKVAQDSAFMRNDEFLFLYEQFVCATEEFLDYEKEDSIELAYENYMRNLKTKPLTSVSCNDAT